MADELKLNTSEFSATSELNALHFLIQSIVKGMVNTAIPVRVDEVNRTGEGGGAEYLSATPLVEMRSASGEAIPNVTIPKLRWFRLQHGTAAIIIDPKPGDIGLAIFAQQDVSALSGGNTPVQPGSFRCFDMSDGFYVGGFWGKTPTTFIHLEDEGTLHVVAPKTIDEETTALTIKCETAKLECDTATVEASSSVKVDTPTTTVTGDVIIQKTLTVQKTATVVGTITGMGGFAISGGSGATCKVTGSVETTGDVKAGGISLQGHTHRGDSGGTTGAPQ